MKSDSTKWALITGAGRQRVGFHVARALGKKGYSLALHYRTSATEARESAGILSQEGFETRIFQADLAVESQVGRLVEQLHSECGRLDALVSCASTWHAVELEKTTAADYLGFFESNVGNGIDRPKSRFIDDPTARRWVHRDRWRLGSDTALFELFGLPHEQRGYTGFHQSLGSGIGSFKPEGTSELCGAWPGDATCRTFPPRPRGGDRRHTGST